MIHIVDMKRRYRKVICINCGQKQTTGNFCGRCGAQFLDTHSANKESIAPANETIKPNPHIENIKGKSKLYFNYFMQYLKTPSHVYNKGEEEFLNATISAILLAVLIGLSYFTIASSNPYDIYTTSFFSVFGNILIFSIASIGLVLFTLTLINHFFGPQHSFKIIVSLYGGHLPPVILLGLVSMLFMLLKLFTFGSITLVIIFAFAIFVLPLYLISLLLTHKSSNVDPLYGFVIYLVTISILFAVFMTILADSSVSNHLSNFRYWF